MAEHVHWANKEDVIPPPDATQLPGSLIVDADEGEPIPHASPTVPTSKSPRSSIMKPIGNHDTPSFAFQMPLKDDSEDLPANPPPPLLTSQSSQYLGPSTVESSSRRRSSLAGTPGMLRTDGPWWTDSTGRTLMLRGVNVSGSAKLPFTPKMPSHVLEGFFDDVNVSFVGRPFPMDEADEHFARLRRWGFNFLRFNVAWEALEHAGPGIYDYEYMDYVVELLKKAKHYGLRVFIDPHQDVWSRFSGGSGAPGWTLRVAGLDATKFKETASAIVHNTYDDPENYPKMIWPTNYAKLACATMFTLFFGGKTFAPQCLGPDGTNIQDFLQNHYFGAFAELAKRIALASVEFGLEDEVVIGYDTLNEPHPGFIGVPNLSIIPVAQDLRIGLMPTPFQGMLLGSGVPCEDVEVWELSWAGPRKKNATSFDPKGVSCWFPSKTSADVTPVLGADCVWARHGVWDPATRKLLKPAYFTSDPATGRSTDFLEDFWRPFVHRFTAAIRAVHRTAVIFIEPPVNEHPPKWDSNLGDPTWRIAYAPHWYDGLTLINKVFNRLYTVDIIGIKRGKYLAPPFAVKFGDTGIRACFRGQLNQLRKEGLQFLGQYPCIMGEIGIPYDMDERKAYKTGDYTDQEHALDINMAALETNMINFTLWNYCSDNSNKWGDGWNGEDLSLFSKADLNPGLIERAKEKKEVVRGRKDSTEKKKRRKVKKGVEEVDGQPKAGNDGLDVVTFPYGRKWSGSNLMDESRDNSTERSTDPLVSRQKNSRKAKSSTAANDDENTIDEEEVGNETSPEPAAMVDDGTTRVELKQLHRMRSDVSISSSKASTSTTSSAAAADAEARLTADEDYLDIGGRALRSFTRPYPVLTPGTPIHQTFHMNTSVFTFTFSHPADPSVPLGGGGHKSRRRGFGHQYRRLYLMPHLHGGMSLGRPSSSSLAAKALQQEDAEVQPTSTVERRRSVLSLSPSTLLLSGGEYTRPATSHTSMSPAILATEVEIYIPRSHYPNPTRDMEVWVSDGKFRVEPADMRLHWRCGCYDEEGKWKGGQSGGDVEHTIVVRRRRDGQEPIGEFGRRRRREVEVELEDGATQASRGGEGDKCPGCEVM